MKPSGELSGRLVVTGHDNNGRAVFLNERHADPMPLAAGGVRATFLWGRDDIATFPDDGSQPPISASQPPPGGARLSTLTIPAGANRNYHDFISNALGDLAEAENPGFHTTPTLDFIIVTHGTFELALDDGQVRVLRVGDTAILNGVRHCWSNPGSEDATLIAAQIGAHRR